MKSYIKRIQDTLLINQLKTSGAVLVVGPKWCGKTCTCEQIANSVIYLQDPDKRKEYEDTIGIKPSLLLNGEKPRLIDEWQMFPILWDVIRFAVDKKNEKGQFILTGSSVPINTNEIKHSGAGRISKIKMRTMSLYESGESSGSISLKKLFDEQNDIEAISKLSVEKIAYAICRGGWPDAVINNNLKAAVNYIEAIIDDDIHRVDNIEKNPERVRKLLKSLARNISTMASIQTIKTDVSGKEVSLTEKTINVYLNALNKIYVTENVPAWNPNIRSKTAIRTSAKRQFVDPSIATAIFRLTPDGLFNDIRYFGFLFESLVTRDLRVYAEANDGNVYHYRDNSGLECDLIISLNDGRWAAIEVKLGKNEIDLAAKNLLALNEKVTDSKATFLMIITGGEYAYKRKDGVFVVPIGCLKD